MNLILLENQDFLGPTLVRLRGRRKQHIVDVHRAAVGDRLKVGKLEGRIGTGEIIALSDHELTMEVHLERQPPPTLPVTLLLALPRPKMLRRILQTISSMGVKQLYLINSYRVDKSFWGSPLLCQDKLREQLILGLEQACDTVLPVIHQRPRFKPFVEDELPGIIGSSSAFLAHPDSNTVCPVEFPRPTTLAIGPEGGFIPYELEKFRSCGFQPVSLGARILRVETAVPVLLSRMNLSVAEARHEKE